MSDEENKLPPSAKILRDHHVGSFCPIVLGAAIGHLMDCGLNDLEILTVIEDFLRARSIVFDSSTRAFLTQFTEKIDKELGKEEGRQ